jgi:hypothetical protein
MTRWIASLTVIIKGNPLEVTRRPPQWSLVSSGVNEHDVRWLLVGGFGLLVGGLRLGDDVVFGLLDFVRHVCFLG